MCHYTISRCGQCGLYQEVVLTTCESYAKQNPTMLGFCSQNNTHDGLVYPDGRHEVICESNVPFPFIANFCSDGTFHSILALHRVQELLSLCSRCSPDGAITPQAAQLGGFLFHLVFDANDLSAVPRRFAIGRYVLDCCKSTACKNARCVNCEETGTCGHHDALKQFKSYLDYQPSMFPVLMQHYNFLREADLFHHPIRKIYQAPATPSQQSELAQTPGSIVTSATIDAMSSNSAQDEGSQTHETRPASSLAGPVSSFGSPSSTPSSSEILLAEGEPPNPVGQSSSGTEEPHWEWSSVLADLAGFGAQFSSQTISNHGNSINATIDAKMYTDGSPEMPAGASGTLNETQVWEQAAAKNEEISSSAVGVADHTDPSVLNPPQCTIEEWEDMLRTICGQSPLMRESTFDWR